MIQDTPKLIKGAVNVTSTEILVEKLAKAWGIESPAIKDHVKHLNKRMRKLRSHTNRQLQVLK